MTISDTNLGAINTASQVFTNINNDNQETNATENVALQAISGLTSLGGSFFDLLSGFKGGQQADETINQPSSQPNTASKTDSVDFMQQSISNSLGLGIPSGESGLNVLEQLTSQASIESMQASLLTALQTSLFSIPSSTDTEGESGKILENVDDEVDENSVINSLSNFSFGENGLELNDAFDSLNIVQHIPIVSAIYQDASGEDISAVSKLTGGYLYGGAVGLAFSALDLAIESYTGSSMNDTLASFDYLSLFTNENVEQASENEEQISESVEQEPLIPPQKTNNYFSAAGQRLASR